MKLNEALELIKFAYHGKQSHDPIPRVKVLDLEYKGIKGQKSYGKRKDLLGWNLNLYSNSQEAEKAIDDIDSFAKLLGSDNKDKYSRIKDFYPEQAAFLRRYMRDGIKGLKRKDGGLWKKTTYDELIKFNSDKY